MTNPVLLLMQVTGGKSMYRIYHLYYPGTPVGISIWILIFGICQIFISLVRAARSHLIPDICPACSSSLYLGVGTRSPGTSDLLLPHTRIEGAVCDLANKLF